MEIFGYEKNGENLLELKEASICCSSDQLDKVIEFLQYVRKIYNNGNLENICHHIHYRDWDKTWEQCSSDLIISFMEKSK